MSPNPRHLQDTVNRLSEIEGVRAGVVVDRNGKPAGQFVTGEDEDLLGLLTGAIFATLNRAAQRSGIGELESVLVSADGGSIYAVRAGDLVLVVLAEPRCNVGLIRFEMGRAASRLMDTDTEAVVSEAAT